MRRLWLAAALLAAILAATLWHSASLRTFTGEVAVLLQEAGDRAAAGRWEEAARLTGQARARWEARDGYLHMTLRHGDTGEIRAGLREVEALLSSREAGAYAAANARLITRICQLWEAEAPTLNNFL